MQILLSLGPLPPSCPRPALVVLSGLPGSGKSTVAHALVTRVPVALLQSDRLRKLLIPTPEYSPEEHERVFGAVHVVLERLLRAGIPAILDATNLTERERRPLAEIAQRAGARAVIVGVEAPEQIVRRRLADRSAGVRAAYDMSDAGGAVYDTMRARAEPIAGPHVRIDTGGDYLPSVKKLAKMLCGPHSTPGQADL